MPSIELSELAIATVFEYPNPFQRAIIEDWASSEGFDVAGSPPPLQIGASGLEIEGDSTRIGESGRFGLLYNQNADLTHFGDSAFVTVADKEGGKSDEVVEYTNSLNQLFEEEGVTDQREFFEITFEGTIRVGEEFDLTESISQSALSFLTNQYEDDSFCGAIRLSTGNVEQVGNYYKLLVDSEGTGNPTRWQFKYVRRNRTLEDYNKGDVLEDLRESLTIFQSEQQV